MRNHIKFLSWRGNHAVPNCQVMSGSMMLLWDLPHVLPAGQDVPTALPCSCICPRRAAREHQGGSYRNCQMLDADFQLAFGFVLWQGFVTPPASQVLALLTAAFPAPGHVGSPARTDSWEWAALPGEGMGYRQVGFGFSGADLPLLFSSDGWGSFLAPLQMLFSS